jgi:hypothetical protein
MDEAAVRSHAQNHLHRTIAQSEELRDMLSAENLLAKLGELDKETREILDEALRQGKLLTALSAIRESRNNIEAFSRIGPMADVEARLRALEAAAGGGKA